MMATGRVCVVGVVVALATVFAGAGSVQAAEYFISPSGDDAKAGTSDAKALKTIGAGVEKARPGDTVNIAPGTYAERVKMPRSGTAQAPITLRRHGEGEVVWTTPEPDPARFQDKYAVCIEGREYIVVRGLTFRDCKAWIVLWESHHATIADCTFDGVRTYNALRINNGSFNRIVGCRFLRAAKQTGFREGSAWIPTPGCDYIEIFRGSHNNLVQGCTFGRITHTAVSISAVDPKQFSPTRNVVRNNVFRDPYWKCLWFHAGKHNVFERNLCTGTAANFVQLESGTSIIRYNRFTHYRDSTNAQPDVLLRGAIRMQYDFAQHNRIYANLFYDNDRTLTNNSFRWHVTDNIFQNNLFFRNRQTIFLGFPDYTTKNRNYFVNNLIVQRGPGEKVIRLTRSNDFTLAEATARLGDLYRGNVESDPQLEIDGKTVKGLKPGSPCRDAGAHLTAVAADGQGRQLAVKDSLWFCDGNGLVPGDGIVIGGPRAGGADRRARIVKVDYDAHTLTLDCDIAWKAGDPVNLAYKGRGPDIGPFEYAGGGTGK